MAKTMSKLDTMLVNDIIKVIDDIVSGEVERPKINDRLNNIELALCDSHFAPQYGIYVADMLKTTPELKESYEKYKEWMRNQFESAESEIPSSVTYIKVLYLDYYYTPYQLLPSYACGSYAEVKDLEGNTYFLKGGTQYEIENGLLNDGFQFIRETSDARLIYWRKK